MKRSESHVRERYFEALKKLHTVLEVTDKVSLFEFVKKQHIANYFTTALLKSGIVVQVDGKRACYKWVGIPPNVAMADRLRLEVKTLRQNYNYERSQKKKKPLMIKEIQVEPILKANGVIGIRPKKYEIKLGWIKATVTPVY